MGWGTGQLSSGGDFEKAPEGTFIGLCYMLVNLGMQKTNFGMKEQLRIWWELPTALMSDGRQFSVYKTYTSSKHPESNLIIDLNGWRGTAFTEAELEIFEFSKLLGTQCFLNIQHNDKYANVKTIMACPDGTQKYPLTNEPIIYDGTDERVFAKLPEYLQNKINTGGQQSAAQGEAVYHPPATPQPAPAPQIAAPQPAGPQPGATSAQVYDERNPPPISQAVVAPPEDFADLEDVPF